VPRFNYKFHRFARLIKWSGGEKIFTLSTVADDYLDEYTKIVFLELGWAANDDEGSTAQNFG
jgi:hypothetical protein